MRSDHGWGVTIGLCFLQTAIVAVFTCCGDPADQGSAYKVHKRVCGEGWRSVDTSSPGSLTEGSPFLAQNWGQQTLCLKVHHNAATWRDARDSCRRQHGSLIDLDFPGFMAPKMVDIIQNLAREIWGEGLRRLWTGMFIERDKLWWENKAPRRVYGHEAGHWWEWLEGQPVQRTEGYGRLDLKNGTNNMSPSNAWLPSLDSDQPFLFTHPSSVFRLGLTLVGGSTLLPYACINNGFVLPPTRASKCPPGWFGSPYVDKCLWFSYHQALSYTDATKVCRDKGAQLAMPQDSFYNAYVTKVILNAELGVLQADDPEVEESSQGHPGVSSVSRVRCIFCTNAQSVEKCQPVTELLNGSCSPDKICGLKVMKRSNGSLAYTGGCFLPAHCEVFSDLTLKHLCTADEAAYTLCCRTPECLHRLLTVVAAFTCAPKPPTAVEVQTPPTTTEEQEVECFTCDGVSSDEECIAKGTVVRCRREFPSMKSPVCQTRVWQESRHSRVKIAKQCVSAAQCQSVQLHDCTFVSVAKKCIYCCEGHRCNQWLPANPILRSPLARKTWIGFQKQETNLVWVDGRVSEVAKWNSTFGSMYPYLPSSGCGQLWADRPWGSEWLVGTCTTSLPFVCETSAQNTEEDVQITTHPRDIMVSLEKLQKDDFFSDFEQPQYDLSIKCGAVNYHSSFPIVWVKDGIFYDNGPPLDGFSLDVTSEMLATPGDSIYNLQGDYHCEVWDKQGRRRAKSKSAKVRFEDVVTYQVSIRIPTHTYNSSVHSQATLLFNPSFRVGLDHYRRMAYSLTLLNSSGDVFPHHISISAYRPGSLTVEFTLFYELPTTEPRELLSFLGVNTSSLSISPNELRARFDEQFRHIVIENIRTKVTSKSSTWYTTYGSWGISPSDVKVLDTAACPMAMTSWRGRKLKWRRTPIGHTSQTEQICIHMNDGRPIGTRRCLGDFYTGAYWEEPSYHDNCIEEESTITTQLRSLSEKEVNQSNSDRILDETFALIQGTPRVVMTDIVYTTQILADVAALPHLNVQSGSKAITTASILMKMNKTLLEDAQKVANSCNRISAAIEDIGRSVNLQDKPSVAFIERNIIVAMYDFVNESTVIQGVGYHGSLTNFTEKYFNSYDFGEQRTSKDSNIGVTLPQELQDIVRDAKDSNNSHPKMYDKVRVTFTLWQGTDLFMGSDNNLTISNISYSSRPPSPLKSVHGAVSVDVRGMKVTDLQQPILSTFTFQQDVKEDDVHCVFWDYSAANGSGDWSRSGCHVHKISQGRVTCACNHLTTFSVLIASQVNSTNSPRVREVAMTLTLLIGLSVSIAGLGLSVISFILFRSFRKTRSQQILFNTAVAALFCNILFWVSLETVVTETYCIAMAALLHYFLLAAFTWILVEAILQFLRVVRMPELPAKYFTLKAAVAGWGFPVIVVGVICAVDHLLYSPKRYLCWLSGLPLYFGFFLPVGVIFAVTMGVSCVVVCKLISGKKSTLKCTEVASNISICHVFSNIVCFVCLVSAWIMAFFVLDSADTIFELVFSVLDAFFGVYVFLLLHFRESSSREKWRQMCCCYGSPTKRDSDSSTTSSVGTISSKMVPTLQKSAIHVEKNIYVMCPSEKRDVVVKV